MISTFFIKRPIVAMVISIVTVIAGLVAMQGLPLAQFPQIVPPQIIISTTYTGADAVTVAQAQPNLPVDVNQFGLAYRKSTGLPMMVIAIFSPHRSRDSLFLANYANI